MLMVKMPAQVEPFLLAAPGANLRERDRRKELLRQRTEHLKLGMEDHQLPEQLQLSYIRWDLALLLFSWSTTAP